MNTEPKKKKRTGWIVLAILSLLGLIGSNAYHLFYKTDNKQQIENLVAQSAIETDSLIQSLTFEKDQAVNLVDSFEREISKWKAELEQIKNAGNSTNLSNNERNALLGQIAQLRRKIAAFGLKANMLDSATRKNLAYEIRLNQKSDSLKSLEQSLNKLSDTISNLKLQKNTLNKTIQTAGNARYGALNISGIDKKKSGNRTQFDASKIEQLKLEFQLIGNTLFKGSKKLELKLRLVGPNGELFTQGGGIIPKARIEDFTFQEDYNYTGKSNSFDYLLTPTKKLSKGKYTLTLFEDGNEISTKTIVLY